MAPIRTNTTGRVDISRVLKAILVRRDCFTHVKAAFPMMDQFLEYGTDTWYEKTYQISSDFVKAKSASDVTTVDSDDDTADAKAFQGSEACGEAQVSTYQCHSVLVTLCEKLNRGLLESSLCQLAATSSPGKELDLAASDNSICKAIAEAAIKHPPL